jgi:hypothetical protein
MTRSGRWADAMSKGRKRPMQTFHNHDEVAVELFDRDTRERIFLFHEAVL